MAQLVSPCRVGDVLIAGSYRVAPEELASFAQERAYGAILAQPGAAPLSMRCPQVDGSAIPDALLEAKAVGCIQAVGLFRGFDTSVAHVGRLRVLTAPVVGEPITAVATVRYRSVRVGTTHLTLRVELRRASGDILARFDMGLDLTAKAVRGDGEARELRAA